MQMFTEINVQTVEPDESCRGGGRHTQQVYNSKLHKLAAQRQNEVEAARAGGPMNIAIPNMNAIVELTYNCTASKLLKK